VNFRVIGLLGYRVIGFIGFVGFTTAAVIYNPSYAGEPPVSELPALTLDDCIKAALANNPGLQEAVSNVDLNKAGVGSAKSAYLPHLSTTGAYTHYDKRILKILETEISDIGPDNGAEPGEVIDITRDKGMIVKAGAGRVALKYIQLEGKKILDADSFLRGHRIIPGFKFP